MQTISFIIRNANTSFPKWRPRCHRSGPVVRSSSCSSCFWNLHPDGKLVGIDPGLVLSSIISIIHTLRSLFFSHVHTRFVLCLRKGIYLWKRAISKTLRSAEWLKGAMWYNKKIRKKNYRKFKFFLN